ncbi:MAG TPA: class I SAM-dependent methyltransferase [Planctomicrobium sp.]|nr:class I SAM-dependent methyltransferase [Planctomicrobium sp.]
MAAKDFGLIESDYSFFMAHATEAESDVAEYARQLAGFADGRDLIRLLDFGYGTGDFTQMLLSTLNWSPEFLNLTLVEPVGHQQEEAALKLARYSQFPIETLATLPSVQVPQFDLVFSNHVLYYVDDLGSTLQQLISSLKPDGKLLLAIAGWDNPLIQIWKTGFELSGRPVPYHVSEDVEAIITAQGTRFWKSKSFYRLCFPDSVDNRLKILRFLFGEHLREIPLQRLLEEFDCFVYDDHIQIETDSNHFAIEV